MAGDTLPIILCPLAVERRALLRAGLGDSWEIHCCGPGALGIDRWFSQEQPHGRAIVLAGLAGGVSPNARAGAAYAVSRVILDGGRSVSPTWAIAAGCGLATATVACSAAALVTSNDKRAFANEMGADLVDLESAAYAEAATAAGLPWAIVRGVSDDATTALPPGIDDWVDDRGRTRLGRVGLALARRPWLAGDLARLQKRSEEALKAVAAALSAWRCADAKIGIRV